MLTDQHRRIDQGVKGIADGTGPLAALAEALSLLRLHLYVEEGLLFPPLVQSGLAMPVFVMKREHGQMWPLLQELAAGCVATTPVAKLQAAARELFQLLQIHNTKEEQIVYTAADRLVADHADGPLIQALTAAQVPDGWVCAMAMH
jgi:iron-sulfur cluster repair protein YtfE (RIC family)